MANYFADKELVVAIIVSLICLSQERFPGVVRATIGAVFSLSARCFRCTINTSGTFNTILEYCQVLIMY